MSPLAETKKQSAPERLLESALRRVLTPALVAEAERSPRDLGGPNPDFFWRHRGPGRGGLAVYVDGCQWHGCPVHYRSPKGANPDHGLTPERVAKQKHTDSVTRRALAARGVKVLAFWEHDLTAGSEKCAKTVREALAA